MVKQKITELTLQVYEAINAQDTAALRRIFHPQIIRHALGEVGVERALTTMAQTFNKNSQTRFKVEDILADGEKTAVRVSVHRPENPADRHPPCIIEIFYFQQNQVIEIWGAGISAPHFPK